jgi:hypothetical protein
MHVQQVEFPPWKILINSNDIFDKIDIYQYSIQHKKAHENIRTPIPIHSTSVPTSKGLVYNRTPKQVEELHKWPFIMYGIGVFGLILLLIFSLIKICKEYNNKITALNLYRTSLGQYLPGVYVNVTQV